MKKLFGILLLFCSIGLSQSNNIDVTLSGVKYRLDTLTTAIDTMDVRYGPTNQYPSYTITAYTLSGTDTLTVYTKSWNNSFWSQVALVDLSTLSSVTTIAASTTKKEFVIADTSPYAIRVISSSDDGSSTVVLITGKGK